MKNCLLIILAFSILSFGCTYQAVNIVTIPDKVDIYVNGIPHGKSPVTAKLLTDGFGADSFAKSHLIIARMDGFEDEKLVLRSPSSFWNNTKPFPVTVTLKLRKIEPDAADEKGPVTRAVGTGWPTKFGYVVTNYHVVREHDKITLILTDGKEIPATIFARDKVNDIALLKVSNSDELPAALPLSGTNPGAGAKVFTLGYPLVSILGTKPKFTDGVISSLSGFQDDPRTYQITVPLQAGNSGGPLINQNGEVVGIVTYKLDAVKVFEWTGDLPQNVNYAVKIHYLKALLDFLVSQSSPVKELTRGPANLEDLVRRIQSSVIIVLAE